MIIYFYQKEKEYYKVYNKYRRAKKLDKLAETSEFSPEDRTELRNYINQKYKELNK